MSPKKRRHVVATRRILGFMIRSLEGRASVYQEAPLQLRELDSEPEPDVLVCSNPDVTAYGTSETAPLLVIEVADSSVSYDLGEKAALYAEAGIPEYWVVNLVDRVVEVFRQPRSGRFESHQVVGAGERLAPDAWPDAAIELSSLFRDLDA
jgi:Uma2 family endonuclease